MHSVYSPAIVPILTYLTKYILYCPVSNLRTIIVIADIHQGLQQSPCTSRRARIRNFRGFSASFRFVRSVMRTTPLFDLLALVRCHPLYILLPSSQGAVFLVNSCQEYFRCGPLNKQWASLIPKLRLLFCRVPWGPLTRSSWSTRPDHLCRFAVRITYFYA